MNEDEVLERLEHIGQAFANDYNDGDGPAYEGFTILDGGEEVWLQYDATLENGTEVTCVFRLACEGIEIMVG